MKKRIASVFLVLVLLLGTVGVPEKAAATADIGAEPGAVMRADLGIDIENTAKNAAKALIQAGIKKIPYVGNTASGLLGPLINKVLGIKPGPGIGDVMNELEEIKKELAKIENELADIEKSLSNMKNQIDTATQDILDGLYRNDTFGNFNVKLNEINSITDKLYYRIRIIYQDQTTSEEYKRAMIAQLLPFDSTSTTDYMNQVITLSKYIEGTQISCTNNRSIFENAYLSACKDSALGGEAAMRVAEYLNQVSYSMSYAFKAMVIVLDSKNYVAANLTDMLAKTGPDAGDEYDADLANILDAEFRKTYADKTNRQYWTDLSEEGSMSITSMHNRFFSDDSDSVAQQYNQYVEDHWFGYIRNWEINAGDVAVEFVALKPRLTCVTPARVGYVNPGNDLNKQSDMVDRVYTDIQHELRSTLQKEEIENLINHMMQNRNNVFVDVETNGSNSISEASILDVLREYGFEADDVEGTSFFLSDTQGSYQLSFDGINCQDKNSYEGVNGALMTGKDWQHVQYYDNDYDFKSNDYVFYYFSLDDIELNNVDDFLTFIQSVSEGTTYYHTTVNLNCDLKMSGLNYAKYWTGSMLGTAFKYGFRGTFNGNGHIINGLTMKCDENNVYGCGLFCSLGKDAVVSDLQFNNITLESTLHNNKWEHPGYGAVAGRVNDEKVTVKNVTVRSGSVTGHNYVGGIIGAIGGKSCRILNCENSATVTSTGLYAGGIVGKVEERYYSADAVISDCINNGTVIAKGKDNAAGGIAGFVTGSVMPITNCTNNGEVKGDLENGGEAIAAGGIAGNGVQVKMNNCCNNGPVTGTMAGGIVANGQYDHSFVYCTNNGAITGLNCAGGILGTHTGTAHFQNCLNVGAIASTGISGGIMGSAINSNVYDVVRDCTNEGTVGGLVAGGIIGSTEHGSKFDYLINRGAVTGLQTAGGIIGQATVIGSTFNNCGNSGDVKAINDAGGIAGRLDDKTFILNICVNNGTVNGVRAGGMVGVLETEKTDNELTQCQNLGAITSDYDTAGGLIGMSYGGGKFTDNKSWGDVTSVDYAGGLIGHNDKKVCEFKNNSVKGAVQGKDNHTASICGYDNRTKSSVTGSIFSSGSILIIGIVVLVLLAAAIILFVVVRKKKKAGDGGNRETDDTNAASETNDANAAPEEESK